MKTQGNVRVLALPGGGKRGAFWERFGLVLGFPFWFPCGVELGCGSGAGAQKEIAKENKQLD